MPAEIENKASDIVKEIQHLGLETLTQAKNAEEKTEHQYRTLTLASGLVTLAGAALTIIGVFLGIEGSRQGEG